MKSMSRAVALLLTCLALGHSALAQSYRVDFGANNLFPVPSPTYCFDCCMCPTGQWNAIDGNAVGATPLVDVSGVNAGVTLERSGGQGNFQFNNSLTSGDDERLLDDLQNVGPVGATTTWTLRGLPNGLYRIKVCAFGADDPTQVTAVTVQGGVRGKTLVGGVATLPFEYGNAVVMYDYVGVLNGEVSFTAETSQGFGSLNGFILDPGYCGYAWAYACAAKVNSLGCTPVIWFQGSSSASATGGFSLHSSNVLNQKSGLLLYGFNGHASIPFQGGTLCVQGPVHRAKAVTSGGSPPGVSDCTGVFSMDMNRFAAGLLGGNPHPALRIPNTLVSVQWWGRDPGFPAPYNSTLSRGFHYIVCP